MEAQAVDDVRKRIDKTLAELRQEADELRVKVHLAKLEAHDEWQEIETKLAALEAKAKELADVSAASAKDIGAAAKLLGEEVRKGLQSFVKHL
jgi:SMC interacting uncharacterized protein involved in chromosome segregation